MSETDHPNEPIDISSFSNTELRAIATRNLLECCAECRALLREQLEDEEFFH